MPTFKLPLTTVASSSVTTILSMVTLPSLVTTMSYVILSPTINAPSVPLPVLETVFNMMRDGLETGSTSTSDSLFVVSGSNSLASTVALFL